MTILPFGFRFSIRTLLFMFIAFGVALSVWSQGRKARSQCASIRLAGYTPLLKYKLPPGLRYICGVHFVATIREVDLHGGGIPNRKICGVLKELRYLDTIWIRDWDPYKGRCWRYNLVRRRFPEVVLRNYFDNDSSYRKMQMSIGDEKGIYVADSYLTTDEFSLRHFLRIVTLVWGFLATLTWGFGLAMKRLGDNKK